MKPHKHAELIKAWADGATIKANIPNEVDFSKGIHNLNIIFENLEANK